MTEKKKEGFFAKFEKFSVPAILILTFAIGGSYAVTQQTLASHTGKINSISEEQSKLEDKVNEIEKVPVKYDEQIKNLADQQKQQQETTNQNIRDLRESVERTNELIIKILDEKGKHK